MSILDVIGVEHAFNAIPVLRNVTFRAEAGEIIGLIGSSGAGKSTLLRALCGLERVNAGQILLQDKDITTLPEADLRIARQKIGLVFQHFNLMQTKTAAQNIALPLRIGGWSADNRQARVRELLDLVGLSKDRHKYPSQLSGGQKQRVGIARALANAPSLLLCDEATSALDPQNTTTILDLLYDINQKLGLTIILITHEMDIVRRFARRVLVLDRGTLLHDGPMLDLLTSRANHPYVQSLCHEMRPALPPDIQNALRSQGSQAVIRVILTHGATREPLIAELTVRFGMRAILIAGGTTVWSGVPVSDLVLQCDRALTDDVKHYLSHTAQFVEIIGYVSSHP